MAILAIKKIIALATTVAVGTLGLDAPTGAAPRGEVQISEVDVTNLTAFRGVTPRQVDSLKQQKVRRLDFPISHECEGIERLEDKVGPRCFDGFELTTSPEEAAVTQSIGEVTVKDDRTGNVQADLPGGVARVVLRKKLTEVRVTYPGDDRDSVIKQLKQRYTGSTTGTLMDMLGRQGKVLRLTAQYPEPEQAERRNSAFHHELTAGEFTRIYIPWAMVSQGGFGKIAMDHVLSGYQALKTGIRPTQQPELNAEKGLDKLKAECKSDLQGPICEVAGQNWASTNSKLTIAKKVIDQIGANEGAISAISSGLEKVKPNAATATPKGALAHATKLVKANTRLQNLAKSAKASGIGALQVASYGVSMAMLINNWNDISPLDKAESITSIIPIVGQGISFFNAAQKGDMEGVAVSTLSVIGVTVAGVCGPCAAAIGVGLALYSLISWAVAHAHAEAAERERAAKQARIEQFLKDFKEKGGVFEWEDPQYDAGIYLPPDYGVKTQTIKLSTKEVPYLLAKGEFITIPFPYTWQDAYVYPGKPATDAKKRGFLEVVDVSVWQGGKRTMTKCTDKWINEAETTGFAGAASVCEAQQQVAVTPEQPTWLDITYISRQHKKHPQTKEVGGHCEWAKSGLAPYAPYNSSKHVAPISKLKPVVESDYCQVPGGIGLKITGRAGDDVVPLGFSIPFTFEDIPMGRG
ncbi:hypothetical protein [Amycolatopsis sp. cmx-11-12]|uniref:hypothetical protein n=1 Tax=Amycolatopsis sp. cmx-11-12 TaxID=2785795 RepID=UPI003917FF37